jgi:uncharacterized DUF497 family protein
MGLLSRMPNGFSRGQRLNELTTDYGEIRVYAIGLVNGLEITVIYSYRNADEIRLISAWRSEPHERRRYWEKIEG